MFAYEARTTSNKGVANALAGFVCSASVPAMVEHIIPRWARTVGDLHRSLSRVRSHCRQCGIQQVVEIDVLMAMYGATASLVNRVGRCAVVGCQGPVYYTAYKTYGRMQIRLVTDPEMVEKIETLAAAPVNAFTLRKVAGLPTTGPQPKR